MNYEKIIMEVKDLRLTGNIVPINWFKTIRRESKDGKIGRPYLLAINILSDIVYWYRPREVRDEQTGNFIRYEKKFKADLLQRSYKQISELFGCSKREAIDAVIRLEKIGVIKRHFRTIRNEDFVANNVLFIELIPNKLKILTNEVEGCEAMPQLNSATTHGGDSPEFTGEGLTFKSGRVPTENGGQIQRLHTEISNKNNIYIYDHFEKNDRVSDLAEQGMKAIKEENFDLSKTKRSSLNNGIAISKSENKESIKENNSNSADNKKAPRVSEKQLKNEFEEIWNSYPRKQGKKVAEAAYIRARRRGVEADVVASGIKSYVDYINAKKISQEYIKQGSTFFNQNSWDDEWETGNKPVSTGNKGHKDSYLADLEVAREEARKFNDQKYLKEIDELERQYLEGMKKKEE